MIEIITEHVIMPEINSRKYQKHSLDLNGKKWVIKDGEKEVYKGNFKDSSLICHNLNKKYYRNEVLL